MCIYYFRVVYEKYKNLKYIILLVLADIQINIKFLIYRLFENLISVKYEH